MSDNLNLWNQVCETDPKYTKPVSFGKYKFTDIDSTWNIKRATALWGPYGSTWGLVSFVIRDILGGESGTIGLWIHGRFKYPGGEFDIAADMPYEPKGEVLKKLQTMCIGKALSRLGFSADVYEGLFDDSAYVKEMEEKYAQPDTAPVHSGGGTDVVPDATKQVAKPPKKHAKYPDPDPNASGILGALSQQYMEKIANNGTYAGKVVNFVMVCHAVYDRFGKYPTKMESLPMLMEAIPVELVIEENEFLKGL